MTSLSQLTDAVVPDVVALYTARDGPAVKNILSRRYEKDATFEDGLVFVKNDDLVPQFTSLKLFPQVSVSVVGTPQATALASAPNKCKIEFQNKQSYSLPSPLGGTLAAATVTLLVHTSLSVDSRSGKISKHVDKWRSVGLGGGAAGQIPILMTPPRLFRSFVGRVSSAAMRAVGVGSGGGSGSGAVGGEATIAAGRAGVRDKVRSFLSVKAD